MSSIIGANALVGVGATVVDCVLGERAEVAAGALIEGDRVAGPSAR